MSPLSPIRIFILGALSWLVLGVGLYCLWEGYTRSLPPASLPIREEVAKFDQPAALDATEVGRFERPTPLGDAPRRVWPFLLCGTILIVISFGGFWPANFLLSSGSVPIPKSLGGKSHHVSSADGSKIAVEVFDHLSSPTLVFTHGWSLDRSAWNYAIERFRGKYRLVTWDLPGLGGSLAPPDKTYSMERFANNLQQVITSVDNGQPIILVGHSIGGMIIQTHMQLFPSEELIKGIVLVHTTYTNPLKTMLGSSLWIAIQKAILVPLHWLVIAMGPIAYLLNWQSYMNGSLHMTARITSFTGRQSRQQLNYASFLSAKAWPPHIARGNLAMMDFDSQETLPHNKLPLLAIAGRHDLVTKPIASEHIIDLAGASKPVYVDGGHLSIWEFQADVLDFIEQFVQNVVNRSKVSQSIPEEV